ncbi:MAG TPA: hypothetical protein VH185_01450 [Mycobacterium sp.]|nr:hypothetical protein [Mycobacterium sp.]
MADPFVGHIVRRALMDDIADRDEERSADGEQGGDIRLVHPRPPVVLGKSVGKCIAKGVGAGRGDLFE